MAEPDIAAELDRLAAELRRARVATPTGAAAAGPVAMDPEAAPPPGLAEAEALVAELAATLARGVGEAEEAIAEHPWAGVGAAFLLGVAVGRLLPRG